MDLLLLKTVVSIMIVMRALPTIPSAVGAQQLKNVRKEIVLDQHKDFVYMHGNMANATNVRRVLIVGHVLTMMKNVFGVRRSKLVYLLDILVVRMPQVVDVKIRLHVLHALVQGHVSGVREKKFVSPKPIQRFFVSL